MADTSKHNTRSPPKLPAMIASTFFQLFTFLTNPSLFNLIILVYVATPVLGVGTFTLTLWHTTTAIAFIISMLAYLLRVANNHELSSLKSQLLNLEHENRQLHSQANFLRSKIRRLQDQPNASIQAAASLALVDHLQTYHDHCICLLDVIEIFLNQILDQDLEVYKLTSRSNLVQNIPLKTVAYLRNIRGFLSLVNPTRTILPRITPDERQDFNEKISRQVCEIKEWASSRLKEIRKEAEAKSTKTENETRSEGDKQSMKSH